MHEDVRATVLLVEDEFLVRMVGADILMDAGFHVLEAANGDEALTVLEDRDDVSVLFTDIDMPGSLDGLELARVAHGRWPHLAVLIVSGKVRPGPSEVPPGGQFIGKPYQPDAVVEQIHGMLRQVRQDAS